MADHDPHAADDVEAIFHEVVDLDPPSQRQRLAERCRENLTLRARVEALLEHDRGASSAFLAGAKEPLSAFPDGMPERIGRYRIIRLLGEGGMGVVYEAEQDNPRREVALKLMRSAFGGRSLIARFEREAAALARMRHPGIAQIYEAGSVTDVRGGCTPYFAMELVRGAPLDQFVRERGLTARQVLALVAEIAETVQHAHEQGVVHRDLKPANIVVEAAGDAAPRPKILDFGIARIAEPEGSAEMSLRTDVGQLLGTIPYMSPEQVAGDSSRIDARTDVYALGVVLFELLAGRLPLDLRGRPIAEAARIIHDEDPTRLSAVSRIFRGDVETIVGTAMEKEPGRRYPSAGTFAADIRRHLSHTPILARPSSGIDQLRKFGRRHRTLVASAALVLLATTTAALVSTSAWFRAERERVSAERRYEIASELSDLIRRDVIESLQTFPGTRQVRLGILKKVTPFYEELARERPDDPARIRNAWLSLIALGREYEIVGEIELARGTLRQGEAAIRNALTRKDTKAFREDLATARFYQGWIEYRGGDRALAGSMYRDSIELLRPVVAADGQQSSAGEKLALAYRRLGDLLNESGDGVGAKAEYLRALAIDEAQAAVQPNLASVQMNLTRTWRRLGQIARQNGELDDAMDWLRRTVERREEIIAREEPNNESEHNLSVALQDLGAVQLEARDVGAAATLRRAVDVSRRVLDHDPTDALARQELAICLAQLASAQLRSGATDDAVASATESLLIVHQMTARHDPPTAHLAVAASILVDIEPAELRQPGEALALVERAIEQSGGSDLAMWLTKAKALHMLGRADEAVAAQSRAIEMIGAADRRRRTEAEAALATYRGASVP